MDPDLGGSWFGRGGGLNQDVGGASALMDPDLGGGWGGVHPNLMASEQALEPLALALLFWLSFLWVNNDKFR